MNIAKKPYEISLWEDELVWHTRELEPIQILEKDYKPGKFFSQNKDVFGAIPYRLDYNQYNDGQRYYTIKANGLVKEGDSADQVKIENLEDWKNKEEIYEVKNPFANEKDWKEEQWFTFSNDSNEFVESNEEKPSADKIYYIKKEKGTYYVPNSLQTFYKEVKLCVIGSDSMESPARCVNPKLVQKINGENTLTFTMYYRYWDDDAQAIINNPFNYLMVNERKIKLRLGPEAETEDDTRCKWFDFIIKNVQENSETKAFTYTCKDQFVNELSKSGFDLVLDNELENNMGTIDVLADRILEGSDWQVDGANTENLKQYKEEPLYKIKVAGNLSATSLEKIGEGEDAAYQTIENLNDKYIYVFYSIINNKNEKIQFLYLPDNETTFVTDDNLLIDKNKYPNYELDGEFKYTNGENQEWPSFTGKINDIWDANISTKYRGARLVKQVQTKYDSTIDKYVGVYKKDNEQYYGYTEDEYISSGAIINYAANPSSFTNVVGWDSDAKHLDYKVASEKEKDGIYKSYLEIDFAGKKGALVKNAGIGGNRSNIKGFKLGEKYVLRMKYKTSLNGGYMTNAPKEVKICEYHMDDGNFIIKQEIEVEGQKQKLDKYKIFKFSTEELGAGLPKYTNDLKAEIGEDNTPTGNYTYYEKIIDANGQEKQSGPDNYIYMLASCERGISEKQLANWDFKIGLFFDFDTEDKIYIEDVQVFPYETYNDGEERLCVPGGKLHSEIKTKYVYYKPNREWESIKDLDPTYSGYTNDTTYHQEFNVESEIPGADGFTKIRSISAKESNRFNLIQTLCETFECWPKLAVKRNQRTGRIYYGKDSYINANGARVYFEADNPYRLQKFISFHEYTGEDNFVGFRYGINSKSIQRTVDSAAVVSKMIVKDNANEFAPNGFCSIARASENPTGENFLLNFDHYVRQNLLDFDIITNDLYLDADGYLGYYKKLKRLNAERNTKIDTQSGRSTDISNYKSAYTTYKTSYDSAVENQLVYERDFNKLAGTNYEHGENGDKFAEAVEQLKKTEGLSDDLNKYWVKWTQCQNVIIQHKPLYLKAEKNLKQAEDEYKEIQRWLEDLAEQKRALNLQFYKKYSRFIQEGSWMKEDYTDPNLYYLDSESTLHTSAQPKVTYDIKVIDVAPLASQEGYEDFAYYNFKIGDKTYIEDVEFFGWSLQNRTQPYREEIVVSEITTELDAPEKNQFKVQNYKTQFEDLFQRITAQTQQAEYHTGEYQRAAAIVEPNGILSADTLENSFANNSFKLSNARDQSVVWDESGITTSSLSNPSEMVRIISGGIFLSNDGGTSWKTGITGSGINTSYLTTGQINTNEIIIRSGSFSSFRWDSFGLNAYDFELENGQPHSFNTSKFVRFDQYGIYGINGTATFKPENEDAIWNNQYTKYALTWKGFLLKSDNGSVRISSEDDIKVIDDKDNERIKIGKLDSGTYGIRISKSIDQPVMVTDDNGDLWLKDRLKIGGSSAGSNQYTVEIGNLTQQGTGLQDQVINANNKFIVYADGSIQASNGTIASASFSQELITVNNAGFKIKGPEGQNLLYFDTNTKKLVVTGEINATSGTFGGTLTAATGEFKGTLTAVTGDFSGKITATEGSIGGMSLTRGILQTETTDEKPIPALEINTNTGEIIAQNIVLGSSAKIADKIAFSSKGQEVAYIYNPDAYKTKFIEAGPQSNNTFAMTIFSDGQAQFGNISINGSTSTIKDINNGFEITPLYASFSNINCSGVIETVVFKKGLVQAAGGAVIFRPSYKIENIQAADADNQKWLELNEQFDGDINTCLWLIKSYENPNIVGTKYTEAKILENNQSSKRVKVLLKDNHNIDFKMVVDVGTKNYIEAPQEKNPNKEYYVLFNGFFNKINISEISSGQTVYEIDPNQYALAETFKAGTIYYKKEDGVNIYTITEDVVDENNISSYYKATGKLQPEFIMGINAGNASIGPANELQPRGLTIKEHGNVLPKLFLGDLSTANIGQDKQGYGLYCDNVYLNGSLVTTSTTGKTAGVNTTSGIYGLTEYVNDTSPIIFWAGAGGADDIPINEAPFQVTENGYVRATQATFSDSVFAGGSIESASIRTAKIFGNGRTNSPALSVFGSSTGISFYKEEVSEGSSPEETFSITATAFSKGDSTFIDLTNNTVQFNGQLNGSLKTVSALISEKEVSTEKQLQVEVGNNIRAYFTSDQTVLNKTVKFKDGAFTMEYKSTNDGYNLYIT